MTISKEKVREIAKKYWVTIMNCGDVEMAFLFIADILDAEREAVKEAEPWATRYIDEMNTASCVLRDIVDDVVDTMGVE